MTIAKSTKRVLLAISFVAGASVIGTEIPVFIGGGIATMILSGVYMLSMMEW